MYVDVLISELWQILVTTGQNQAVCFLLLPSKVNWLQLHIEWTVQIRVMQDTFGQFLLEISDAVCSCIELVGLSVWESYKYCPAQSTIQPSVGSSNCV